VDEHLSQILGLVNVGAHVKRVEDFEGKPALLGDGDVFEKTHLIEVDFES
jgi:hypothetical protein